MMPRMRDFGVTPGNLSPGPLNAITDVKGIRVGHTTVNRDVNGVPWRSGVTAIWPHMGNPLVDRVYAATFPLNGYGVMTASSIINELGLLDSPIVLTGTNHVGIVYHWTLQYLYEHMVTGTGNTALMPLIAECDDSYLDGSQGRAISRDDVYAALDNASSVIVAEGSVGAGTGLKLFDFKGGIGTSSRIVQVGESYYTVGVLVLTNFGARYQLRIDGVPVGRILDEMQPEVANDGSCIVVLATDAPLNPRQCERLAKRAALGLARTGSIARDLSGEMIIAFATGNSIPGNGEQKINVQVLVEGSHAYGASPLNELFTGGIEATEEAIYNALVTANTISGIHGHILQAISHDRLRLALRSY
ncbi:MAG TPA: P1 family peptidase [Ktedonobacteraceae bacterium]|nr:P1 family peptidase [Ktedonobacteraceae bacterium]